MKQGYMSGIYVAFRHFLETFHIKKFTETGFSSFYYITFVKYQYFKYMHMVRRKNEVTNGM